MLSILLRIWQLALKLVSMLTSFQNDTKKTLQLILDGQSAQSKQLQQIIDLLWAIVDRDDDRIPWDSHFGIKQN